MKQVGIVGWRGMVGSVLLQRMLEENDFNDIAASFLVRLLLGHLGLSLMVSVRYLKMRIHWMRWRKWISSLPARAVNIQNRCINH